MNFDENDVFHLDQVELIQIFSVAFTRMLERDRELFESPNQAQERTFMHRFAFELHNMLYLAEDFRDLQGRPILSLDVEYNRDGDSIKRHGENWIAPDILLHQRGSGKLDGANKYKNDVFVCELKKDDPNENDDARVRDFVCNRKYMYGINFYKMTSGLHEFKLYWGETDENGARVCCGPSRWRYEEADKRFVEC